MFKTISKNKEPESIEEGREEVELLEMCRNCYAFKYDNGWHFDKPEYLREDGSDQEVFVQFSRCSACIEEALATYDMEYA